jgi:hypothetical protein
MQDLKMLTKANRKETSTSEKANRKG